MYLVSSFMRKGFCKLSSMKNAVSMRFCVDTSTWASKYFDVRLATSGGRAPHRVRLKEAGTVSPVPVR